MSIAFSIFIALILATRCMEMGLSLDTTTIAVAIIFAGGLAGLKD